jgi:hypothetical protein
VAIQFRFSYFFSAYFYHKYIIITDHQDSSEQGIKKVWLSKQGLASRQGLASMACIFILKYQLNYNFLQQMKIIHLEDYGTLRSAGDHSRSVSIKES